MFTSKKIMARCIWRLGRQWAQWVLLNTIAGTNKSWGSFRTEPRNMHGIPGSSRIGSWKSRWNVRTFRWNCKNAVGIVDISSPLLILTSTLRVSSIVIGSQKNRYCDPSLTIKLSPSVVMPHPCPVCVLHSSHTTRSTGTNTMFCHMVVRQGVWSSLALG